jgi:Ring finger domain
MVSKEWLVAQTSTEVCTINMHASMNPPSNNYSSTPHSNSTQTPAMGLPPSNDPLAVLTVLVMFGMVCIITALAVRCCPTPTAQEESQETESSAATRRDRERKRSEYVHKVLKTRSWHRLKGAVEHCKPTPCAANALVVVETALTIPTGDSGGSDDKLSPAATEPKPHGVEEPPELESGQSEPPHGADIDLEADESESNMCPPPVPASPCGSVDGRGDDDDDDDGPECAICLCPFEESDRVCEANNASCKHVFHQECLEPWLLRHERCPVCREEYLRRPGRGSKKGKRRNA